MLTPALRAFVTCLSYVCVVSCCLLSSAHSASLNLCVYSYQNGTGFVATGDTGWVTATFVALPGTPAGDHYFNISGASGSYQTVTVNPDGSIANGILLFGDSNLGIPTRAVDLPVAYSQVVGAVSFSTWSGDPDPFNRQHRYASSTPLTIRRNDVPYGTYIPPVPPPTLPPGEALTATVVITFGGPPNPGPDPQPPTSPTETGTEDEQTGGDGGGGGGGNDSNPDCGMIRRSFHSLLASLHLQDTPLSYTPAFGPEIGFTVTYNQKEEQPALNSIASADGFSHLSPRWNFNWLSFVTDNPVADTGAEVYQRGGGTARFQAFNVGTQSYPPVKGSDAVLVKLSATSYEMRFSTGARHLFAASNGATAYPRRIFLTKVFDAFGNAVTLGYGASNRLETLTDASGKVTQIQYQLPIPPDTVSSDYYRIVKVIDPFGRSARFGYSNSRRLEQMTDAVGLVSTIHYSAGDLVDQITTPYGTTSFATGESGGASWIESTDPYGAKERLEYRAFTPSLANAEAVAPAGVFNSELQYRNTFFWDKKAMPVVPGDYSKARITHWMKTADGVNTSGIVGSRKAPLEGRVWYQYPTQPAGNQVGAMDLPSSVARILDDGTTQSTQFEYNAIGRLTKVTDPRGRRTEYSYDATGVDLLNIRQTTGTLNDLLAKFENYTGHRPQKVTDAAGQFSLITYNARGQVLTTTNPKGEAVTNSFVDLTSDAKYGLVQSITQAGGALSAAASFTYDAYNRVLTTKQEEGAGTADDYVLTYAYDAIGADPLKSLDRTARITYPDGTFERFDYDRLHVSDTYDRLGRKTQRFYDNLEHLIKITDPAGRTTQYVHCPCGAMDKIIDARGNETEWVRDVQKRITSKKIAGQTVVTYVYENTTSRLKSVTDVANQAATYSYFPDDHGKDITYTGALHATPNVSFTYDLNYDRLVTMMDGIGTTTYGYVPVNPADAVYGDGQVASVDGAWVNDTLAYTYDQLGRVATRTLNGVGLVGNAFDGLGRATSLVNPLGTFTTSYVGNTGRVDHVDLGNGQRVQLSYLGVMGDDRLAQIQHRQTAAGAVLSQHDYLYAATGRIAEWKQDWAGRAFPQKYVPGYDGADELTGASLRNATSNAVVKSYAYDYDAAGNRIGETIDGVLNPALANGKNQLTEVGGAGQMEVSGLLSEPSVVKVNGVTPTLSDGGLRFTLRPTVTAGLNTFTIEATETTNVPVGLNAQKTTKNYQVNVAAGARKTLAYDANGSLSDDGGTRTFEWDAANRLTRILYTGTNLTTELSYDGMSRCMKIIEKNNGVVTSEKRFVWEGMSMAEERDASNTVTKRFFGQGVQIGATNYYYNRDHLGSVREVTDSTGAVRTRYDYDLWGRRTKINGGASDPEADFGFTGHYYHAASAMVVAPRRLYLPELGRWLSRDPIAEKGGLNLYGYAGNSPTNRTDPLGLSWWCPGDSDYILDFDAALRDWMGVNLSPSDEQAINSINADRTLSDSPMRGFTAGFRGRGMITDSNDITFGANAGATWTMDNGASAQGGVGFNFRLPNAQGINYTTYGARWNEEQGTSFARGLTYTSGNGRVGGGAANGAVSQNITLGINLGPSFQIGVVVDPSRIPVWFRNNF